MEEPELDETHTGTPMVEQFETVEDARRTVETADGVVEEIATSQHSGSRSSGSPQVPKRNLPRVFGYVAEIEGPKATNPSLEL